MLENNFNELDDDFITLWSRQFISKDATQVEKEMEKLAELGQVNAITAYYTLTGRAGKPTNARIDMKTDEKAYSRNFNHILANAYKLYATDPCGKELRDLVKQYNDDLDEIDAISLKISKLHYTEEARFNSLTEDLDEIQTRSEKTFEKIRNNQIVKYQIEAIIACHEQAKQMNNPYAMEKYLELLEGIPIHASNFVERDRREFKREVVQTQKELARLYKSNPTSQTEFALGKNMVFFGKKDKNKQIGIEILTKLAERPLSKTLSEYIATGKVGQKAEGDLYLDLE